jgi:hypothetical protein
MLIQQYANVKLIKLEMDLYVYSLINYKYSYVFIKELQFEIPNLKKKKKKKKKKTYKDRIPLFIENMIKLEVSIFLGGSLI